MLTVFLYTDRMINWLSASRLLSGGAYSLLILCLVLQMIGWVKPLSALSLLVLAFSVLVGLMRVVVIWRIASYNEVIRQVYPNYAQNSVIATEFLLHGLRQATETQGVPYPGKSRMGIIRQLLKDLKR